MKKLGNALILGALAAVLLTAVGCKQEASLGDEAGKWGGQDTSDKSLNTKSLTISADKYDINFICFVDEDGVVQYPKIYKGEAKEDITTVEWTGLAEDEVVKKGSSIAFDFTDLMGDAGTKKFTLYIWQENAEPKEGAAGSKDFRGTVTIQDGVGVKIKASGYKDEVLNVGIVTITCDEPASSSRYPNGDYTITQLRALMPLGKQNDNKQDLFQLNDKFTFDCSIKNGETKSFVFPANGKTANSYAAMAQPGRMKDLTDAEWKDLKEKDPDTPWADTFEKEKELDANRFWSFKEGVPAHTETEYKSSSATVKMCINDDGTYTDASGDKSRSAYDAPAVFVLEPVVPGEK